MGSLALTCCIAAVDAVVWCRCPRCRSVVVQVLILLSECVLTLGCWQKCGGMVEVSGKKWTGSVCAESGILATPSRGHLDALLVAPKAGTTSSPQPPPPDQFSSFQHQPTIHKMNKKSNVNYKVCTCGAWSARDAVGTRHCVSALCNTHTHTHTVDVPWSYGVAHFGEAGEVI